MKKDKKKIRILSVVSLVTGIVAFVFSWVHIIVFFAGALGIVAIVTGVIEMKRLKKSKKIGVDNTMPLGGIVLGSIAVILEFIINIIFIMILKAGN